MVILERTAPNRVLQICMVQAADKYALVPIATLSMDAMRETVKI